MSKAQLIIHTDGGSRGNPGPAAVGVVIEVKEVNGTIKLLAEFGKGIGESTNNVAEYKAVFFALEYLLKAGTTKIQIRLFLDSELVANQLSNKFKIKKPHLQKLYQDVKKLESGGDFEIEYVPIPREENKRADALVNEALNQNLS